MINLLANNNKIGGEIVDQIFKEIRVVKGNKQFSVL